MRQWALLLALWLLACALATYSLARTREAHIQSGFEQMRRQAQTVEQLLAYPLDGTLRHTAYVATVLRAALQWPDAAAALHRVDGSLVATAYGVDGVAQLPMPVAIQRPHLDGSDATDRLRDACSAAGDACLVLQHKLTPEALHREGPLVLVLHRNQATVLATWREQALGTAIGMVLSGVAGALWLGLHQRRRRAQAQAALAVAQAERDSARRMLVALEGADLGLWEWDIPGDTLRVNMREFEMLGYPPQAGPLAPEFWRALLHPDEQAQLEQAVRAHLRGETRGYRIEHRLRHHDGHWVWVLDNARVMQSDAQGRALRVVGTHLDITERKRTQLELERINGQLEALSLTDGLTGVANRRQFDLTLAAEWARAQRRKQPLTVLMIDVDHFKRYNDALGHPQGDACLRALAQTLTNCLRYPQEKLARYGGEEFAVLLAGGLQAGAIVAQRCLDALAAARMPHPDSPVAPQVTISIGVACAQPGGVRTIDDLVREADAALYEAKKSGRARYALGPVAASP